MNEILFHYHQVPATTWVYLSSLLMLALYFKFSRLWSVRNFDLVGLILFAPGLLLVNFGQIREAGDIERLGYIWLFAVGAAFLVRLLVDPLMVRRPLLEPNLSVGGQTFLGVSLLMFLMANVVTSNVTDQDLAGSRRAEQLRKRVEVPVEQSGLDVHGPGYPLLFLLPNFSTQKLYKDDAAAATDDGAVEPREQKLAVHEAAARTMAILSHLAVVIGIVMIGYRHFDNIKTGISAATMYLLLPYTALLTGRVPHVLPAALLVWAVESYRRPLVSGMLMGLAIGVIYYPAFLLPLWISFYWRRGMVRFLGGVVATLLVLVGTLAFTSADQAQFLAHVEQMFGLRAPIMEGLHGFWQYAVPVYRIPVLAAFVALCGSLAVWPAQKNLGTLMSCSAAVMLATQFWHSQGGGVYMAWYLPLMLLTIFRPNLEDRVALSVLGEGWRPQRRARQTRQHAAA
jgi:hypothetical protein